jgi:hypothetical protein
MPQPSTTSTAPRPWATPNDYSPAIYYDLFPTTAKTPTHTYPSARVIVTAAPEPRVYVFVDSPQGPAAQVIAQYDPDQIYGDLKTGLDLKVTQPAEFALQVRPQSGCGCGSQLRRLRAFNTMRHTPAPVTAGPLPAPFTTQAAQPQLV